MKQLSYEEFQKELQREIGSFLPQDAVYETELNRVEKNNMTLQALSIRRVGENTAPNFYLKGYYNQYQSGESLNEICKQIGELYGRITFPDITVRELSSYENIREHLEIHLVSKENNGAFLAKGPYRLNEIGAEIVYVNLEKSKDGQTMMRVTNELMEQYHITPEALFAQAYQNTVEQYPLEIKTMHEVMREIMGMEMDEFLGEVHTNGTQTYVVSNAQRINGATVLLYPDTLRKIEERVGGEYYILPSSTHEVLAIPKNQAPTPTELRQMVREINRDQVKPTERLAGEVFLYKANESQLQKCVIKERGMER